MIIFSKKHGYKIVRIDISDFDKVKKLRWSIVKGKNKHVYYCKAVVNKNPYKNILLHRYILDYNGKLQIDHLNENGLDNRRKNLRIVNQSLNQRNTIRHNNSIWKNVIKGEGYYIASWTN